MNINIPIEIKNIILSYLINWKNYLDLLTLSKEIYHYFKEYYKYLLLILIEYKHKNIKFIYKCVYKNNDYDFRLYLSIINNTEVEKKIIISNRLFDYFIYTSSDMPIEIKYLTIIYLLYNKKLIQYYIDGCSCYCAFGYYLTNDSLLNYDELNYYFKKPMTGKDCTLTKGDVDFYIGTELREDYNDLLRLLKLDND